MPGLLAAATFFAAGVGLLDAMFSGEHDVAVVFGVVAAMSIVQFALAIARPPASSPVGPSRNGSSSRPLKDAPFTARSSPPD
jgi:hypothetical protein